MFDIQLKPNMSTDEQTTVFDILRREWHLVPADGKALRCVCKPLSKFEVIDRFAMIRKYARENNSAGLYLCVMRGPTIPKDTLKYHMLPDNLREPRKIKREDREIDEDALRNVKRKLF